MHLELNEILAIMDKVASTGMDLFEYENGEERIRLRKKMPGKSERTGVQEEKKASSTENVSGQAEAEETSLMITSPMVGTFYVSPAAGEAPFVQVGDQIKKGQTIGIVEAMKLMNEIESEWDGTVEEILVENEQLAEYGQPLMRIRPSGK